MANTKEKILLISLNLFAKFGYEAVSMKDIADKLGITKGALYKHYKNKQDIFNSIVERMYEIARVHSEKCEVPTEKYEVNASSYKKVLLKNVKKFTLSQFEFWLEDNFASDFRKMLTIEQFRTDEMAKLYNSCILNGPVKYMEDIFCEMIKNGFIKKTNPKQLAIQFYAPFYLLMNMSNFKSDTVNLKQILEKHIDDFIEKNSISL